MKIQRATIAAMILAAMTGCSATTTTVLPRASSQSVAVNQVEDAAIWVHPTDPAQSILLICNKTHGVELHDPDGLLIKHYEDGVVLSGIDVMYGEKTTAVEEDIAIIVCSEEKGGVRICKIDAEKRRLREATAGERLPVLEGHIPLGVVGYRSPTTHKPYFFVTCAEGDVEQYEILAGPGETMNIKRVRALEFPSKVKAGVADDQAGTIYFAAEKTGVFALNAEPDSAAKPELVIPASDGHNTPDLTGIDLYRIKNGAGYLILVSQNKKGEATVLNFYQRQSPHAFAGTAIPGANNSYVFGGSGIAVTNRPMGPDFPQGMLALKNRVNPNVSEDYKLYTWPEIAAKAGLTIDPTWSPRK